MTDRVANAIAAALCFITALSLQIQISLFASPTYLGLRINLTDLLVPFAGAAILVTLLTKRSLWPQWNMKHVYIWLAVLTAIFAAALVHTHFTYGEISRWALVNKFGGWIILLAIMGMGAWIATNATQKNLEAFLKIFLWFGLFVIVHQLAILVVYAFPWGKEIAGPIKYFKFPVAGFMANRNSFALLFLTALILATCFHLLRPRTVSPFIVHAMYFLLPLFILFNCSRAGMLGLLILLPVLLIGLGRKAKKQALILFALILVGVAFTAALLHDRKSELFLFQYTPYEFLLGFYDEDRPMAEGVQEGLAYPGDSMRLVILQDALAMAAERPVLGNGLGSMMLYQKKIHGQMINLIDCTPLWILVEMGAIALLIFAAFYFMIAKSFYTAWRSDEEFSKTLRLSLMFILFAFTFMALFHELLYTRFIWFFLGLGLALPARMRQV